VPRTEHSPSARATTAGELRGARRHDCGYVFLEFHHVFHHSHYCCQFTCTRANGIATARQAAEALRPLAGNGAYLLFTVGLIGTGMLGVPVLVGSCAYAVDVGECGVAP
jgi:hypothetical protein